MNEPTTTPPASPEARALRAIGRELDTLGEAVGELSAGVQALAEMGEEDARNAARREGKLDQIIAILTNPESGLVARVGVLESWRGEHERAHVQ
jgi:hypothetical protein